MPRAAMPTEADCEVVLRSLGLFGDDDLTDALEFLDLAIHADAAVRQWEDETGWHPFLANVDEEDEDETRFFDVPGPNFRPQVQGGGYVLDLGGGVVTLTSVNSGWSETSAGTLLTVNTDYRLYPYNAGVLVPPRPYTAVQFTVGQWGLRHSLRLVGRFGYSSTVPEDVWLAVAHQAVRLALPEIATRISGGQNEFSELGVTERFPAGFLTGKDSLGERWAMEWKDAVRRYQRIVV